MIKYNNNYSVEVTNTIQQISQFILKELERLNIPASSITMYKQIEDLKLKRPAHVPSLNKSTFTNKGFKSRDIILNINPNIISNVSAWLLSIADKVAILNYSPFLAQKDEVTIQCKRCNKSENLTIHSLQRRADLCKFCAEGKAPWVGRETEFLALCSELGTTPLYDNYSSIINSNLALKCNNCDFQSSRTFSQLVYRKSFACENCSPSSCYTKGRKTVIDNIVFDSIIESKMYIKLKTLGLRNKLEIKVPYSKLTGNLRLKVISDFVIDDKIVLEVSSFNLKNHPEYANKIEIKRQYLKDTKYTFIVINSLAEVNKFTYKI